MGASAPPKSTADRDDSSWPDRDVPSESSVERYWPPPDRHPLQTTRIQSENQERSNSVANPIPPVQSDQRIAYRPASTGTETISQPPGWELPQGISPEKSSKSNPVGRVRFPDRPPRNRPPYSGRSGPNTRARRSPSPTQSFESALLTVERSVPKADKLQEKADLNDVRVEQRVVALESRP